MLSELVPKWIWAKTVAVRNSYFRFRRVFVLEEFREIRLRITADSRYWLYVNGERIGFGPVRSWPNHWKYDQYDITPYLRCGSNVVAVLVNHYNEGNFQYVHNDPGLWAACIEFNRGGADSVLFETDAAWKTSPSLAHDSLVGRVAVQQGFDEVYDARQEEPWIDAGFDDSGWDNATDIDAPHLELEPRNIPAFTVERVSPKRVVRAESVRRASTSWTINVRAAFAPEDKSVNFKFVKGFLYTQLWSPTTQVVRMNRPHHHSGGLWVNNTWVEGLPAGAGGFSGCQDISIREGWNVVLVPYPKGPSIDREEPVRGIHFPQFAVTFTAESLPLRFSTRMGEEPSAWAFVGPFEFSADEIRQIELHMDFPRVVLPKQFGEGATAARFREICLEGIVEKDLLETSSIREFEEADVVLNNDVVALAFSDQPVQQISTAGSSVILSDNSDWWSVPMPADGHDLRVLVDYGKMVVGYQTFELIAGEGVIIDFHNFEFIQPDGLENYADGMNNGFRYTCRAGRQSFQTLQRRGFQYCWIIIRNFNSEVKIRSVGAEYSTYPQSNRGAFLSNDERLNQIWAVGAHTIRCCSEDTYTDCPSYEQTHWVGDARNEALSDWMINGDPRLWFRCLEQTAQSLERSPLTLSQVPSAWENLLPAWSFLWMRSCYEYLLWTGDTQGAEVLFPWIEQSVAGIRNHLRDDGLFSISGWNMFDWAEMDTPTHGVVTHLNCLAVHALKDASKLAKSLGRFESADSFELLYEEIAQAVNRHLWDHDEKAFVDCLYLDGRRSSIFSQQTQTVAVTSGVAAAERSELCRKIAHTPPEHFVKAGSPFFEFFLLELYVSERRIEEFLSTIREDWGFMITKGASTFWEMWSLKSGRLTRSHCHGWSAAPVFFLSSVVLGITPTMPGFSEVRIFPQIGDLREVRGVVPTPRGDITVACVYSEGKLNVSVKLPRDVKISEDSCSVGVEYY